MKLHANAALTVPQRQEIKRMHEEEQVSIRSLAKQFRVNPTTVQRWVHRESPADRPAGASGRCSVVTDAYRQAVIAYRQDRPTCGPIRIALALKEEYTFAHRGTVLTILQQEGLTRPKKKEKKPSRPIPVGYHRVQMDIQQLPAVQGHKGFEYKITAIHLRTRVKYSEIHPDHRSGTVAGVLTRAMDRLPPFFWSGRTMRRSSP
jgi:hypothetical protein